jgi:hypothetical protein
MWIALCLSHPCDGWPRRKSTPASPDFVIHVATEALLGFIRLTAADRKAQNVGSHESTNARLSR